MLTLGSVCAGIGGFDLGLEMTRGFRTAWQIERDPGRRNVLAARWPDADRSITDLTTATDDDFARLPRTDAQCAGLPCQPISVAGDRLATEDPRWLLPHWLRCLRVLRPRIVLYENPAGVLSPIKRRGRIVDGPPIAHLLGGLAALGYDAEWYVLGADDVGAPHERKRVWLYAWLADADGVTGGLSNLARPGDAEDNGCGADVAHANGRGSEPGGSGRDGDDGTHGGGRGDPRHVQAAQNAGRDELAESAATRLAHGRRRTRGTAGHSEPERLCAALVNAGGAGLEELHPSRVASDAGHVAGRPDSRARELAHADRHGAGQPVCLTERSTAAELVELREEWATRAEPGMGRIADGLPAWLDGRWPAGRGEAQHEWEAPRIAPREANTGRRIAALGDAIVPHCAMVLGYRALERVA